MTLPRSVPLTRRRLLGALPALAAKPMAGVAPAAPPEAPPLPPPFPRDVFRERQLRLTHAMRRSGLDAVVVLPGTNLRYVADLDTWRSERLMALIVTSSSRAAFLTPAFEAERVRRDVVAEEISTWREEEDPLRLAARFLKRGGRIGLEGTTDFHTATRLKETLGARLFDATPLFDALRTVKSEGEKAFIREAARRTERAIEGLHRRLAEGMTEREASVLLEEEFRKQGVRGDGLVQFGASSALPHGGPGESRLKRGDVVLVDCGCRVRGYSSDVTRTAVFGEPSDDARIAWAAVDAAQRAGIAAFRAGALPEEVDRAARRVLEQAGYGPFFTHRLGHGLGMDGHEPPYLVKGNQTPLSAGNVCTIEPGLYLPGKFGMRIEDDFAAREGEAEGLSTRPEELVSLRP